jgi:Flp pilus assembly protein protease CpaA
MNAQILAAILIGLAATVEDILHRRISNWIPICAFAAGVSCLVFRRGWDGLLSSVLGAVGGFAIFFVFYWLGGMGGGDVKLMSGFGAVVGVELVLPAALWTAACGGILAASWVAVSTVRGLWKKSESDRHSQSIPYAPAIALGSWLALLSNV